MNYFFGIFMLFSCIYFFIVLQYLFYYSKLIIFESNSEPKNWQRFSIIIPARNEEINIQKCIESIVLQNYPTNYFEIIVIDDHSTDNTAQIVQNLATKYNFITLLELKNYNKKSIAFKKMAIEYGIQHAKFEWIVTTDADCLVQKNWLNVFNAYINKKNVCCLVAPVKFLYKPNFITNFQILDFMSLQGITAAMVNANKYTMCNGANFAYTKHVFNEINGFENINNIASGDDLLLLYKIKQKYPNKIGYVFNKNAIVETTAMPTIKSFLQQRIRWASKTSAYKDKNMLFSLIVIYFYTIVFLVTIIVEIIHPFYLPYFLFILIIKLFLEYRFLYKISHFFNAKNSLKWFLIIQPFYILYIILAGFLGFFKKTSWKNRIIK